MEKVFTSWNEVEKEYFPKTYERKYLEKLAKGGKIGELARYLVKNNIELHDKKSDLNLTNNMKPGDLGALLGQIVIEEMRSKLSN